MHHRGKLTWQLSLNAQAVRSAYEPPASSIFLSERISHQQPASSALLSEQTSTSHQPTEQAEDAKFVIGPCLRNCIASFS
jgi:hypothetical protein